MKKYSQPQFQLRDSVKATIIRPCCQTSHHVAVLRFWLIRDNGLAVPPGIVHICPRCQTEHRPGVIFPFAANKKRPAG